MEKSIYYKTRLRSRGQLTLPPEVRERLGIREGDDLVFYVTQSGKVMVDRLKVIPPEQAWFWSERWQQMEMEAQADFDAGRYIEYDSAEEAVQALNETANAQDQA